MVMLGHLVLPAWGDLPASLSPTAVDVLRQELGFSGVVVSDDLAMGALSAWDASEVIEMAVTAGNDLLLFVATAAAPEELVDHLTTIVEDGKVPAERVQASVTRILTMQLGSSRPS